MTGFTAVGSGPITDVLSNATNAVGTVVYVITPTANGCAGSPFNFTVTVEPRPTLVSSVTPASSLICDGGGYTIALSTLTVPSSGSVVYDYTAVGSHAGVTGFSASGNDVAAATDIVEALVNNSTTTRQTITYTLTPQIIGSGVGSDCNGTAVVIVISIDPTPAVSSAAAKNI